MDVRDFMFVCEECGVDPLVASEDEGVKNILKKPTSDVNQLLMLSGYLHKTYNR